MILNNADNIFIGNDEVIKVYAGDNEIWTRSGVQEKTGVPPITFRANGTDLIDWSITGAAGGVGNICSNSLKQREYSSEDGLDNGALDPSYSGNIQVFFHPQASAQDNSLPSIPPGTPHTKEYQQWVRMIPGKLLTTWTDFAIDERTNELYPPQFQYAQWKISLPAGSYKLMCELCTTDSSSFYNVYERTENHDRYATFDMIASDGTVIIHKNIASRNYSPNSDIMFDRTGLTAPYFIHEEIPFTLSEETEIGFVPKLYTYLNGEAYFRFYITDTSVVAQPFNDGTYSGVTAWEPYRHKIPVIISSGDQSTTIDVYNVDALTENDTLTMSAAGVTLPTYTGITTIDVDTDITPSEMYIKYNV